MNLSDHIMDKEQERKLVIHSEKAYGEGKRAWRLTSEQFIILAPVNLRIKCLGIKALAVYQTSHSHSYTHWRRVGLECFGKRRISRVTFPCTVYSSTFLIFLRLLQFISLPLFHQPSTLFALFSLSFYEFDLLHILQSCRRCSSASPTLLSGSSPTPCANVSSSFSTLVSCLFFVRRCPFPDCTTYNFWTTCRLSMMLVYELRQVMG